MAVAGLTLVTASAFALPEEGVFAHFATNAGEIVAVLDTDRSPLAAGAFVARAEHTMAGQGFAYPMPLHLLGKWLVETAAESDGVSVPKELSGDFNEPGVLGSLDDAVGNLPGFFLTVTRTPWFAGHQTAFGKIIAGQDVLSGADSGLSILGIKIERKGAAWKNWYPDTGWLNAQAQMFRAKKASEHAAWLRAQDDEIALITHPLAKTPEGVFWRTRDLPHDTRLVKGQLVDLNYSVRLTDGTVVDSTAWRGRPFGVTVGDKQSIRGLDIALSDMRAGENRLLVIPPELAYGEHGLMPAIPGGAWLIVDVTAVPKS